MPSPAAPVAERPVEAVEESGPSPKPKPLSPPLVTPPPKIPETTQQFSRGMRHHTYKSKTCGYFCYRCKKTAEDPSWFHDQPCSPTEFHSPPRDDEEVHTPRKGEAIFIAEQVRKQQELQVKQDLLKEMEREEHRLNMLLAKKRSRNSIQVPCSLPLHICMLYICSNVVFSQSFGFDIICSLPLNPLSPSRS